jgi:hypothetical protein
VKELATVHELIPFKSAVVEGTVLWFDPCEIVEVHQMNMKEGEEQDSIERGIARIRMRDQTDSVFVYDDDKKVPVIINDARRNAAGG